MYLGNEEEKMQTLRVSRRITKRGGRGGACPNKEKERGVGDKTMKETENESG